MAGDDGVRFHNLASGGQVGEAIRAKDWSATPLGPRERWPRSLQNHLSMIFELPTAAIIFWGSDQIQLYNDGYAVIMGPRHPQYLGSTFRECWPEAYPTIYPWMERVLHGGETVEVNRTLVPLTRFGFVEEAYFTFSFSPLRDERGKIAGILQLVTEVTDAVLGERRTSALHELSNQMRADTVEDASRSALLVLSRHVADLPFSLIYVVDPVDPQRLTLAGATRLPTGQELFPAALDLGADNAPALAAIARAARERTFVVLDEDAMQLGETASGPWPEPVSLGVALPISAADQQTVAAVLVGGLSPRLALDDRYRSFLRLVGAQLSTQIAAAQARDDERKRAEARAELDRAKTDFFSNVSHEFRTPLTLILGPLEDALQDPKGLQAEVLATVHRNALRLLRLVNTLLDFARLEADRLSSSFEPTDLATFTAGIVGSFQSLLDSSGLKLRVECPPISEPVHVDRSQWEKIVLNLMSNAFKFTFEGEIAVRQHERDGLVELSVSDTGTGIPAEELPKIFQRFHRVKGARGRSFEGTGIGLALVQELVKQHGGTVRVQSVVGKGTTFVVLIPKRSGASQTAVKPKEPVKATSASLIPYVLEAAHWRGALDEGAHEQGGELPPDETSGEDSRPRVLVVDDNADMRAHLVRLLSPTLSVETAHDGQAGLEAALRQTPDLILSDVMMPRMDGVALVSALRANPSTSTVPIVLLSARAGEEAVVGGFDTGADDYLVKPFGARELLARVQSHLQMARLRREWARELERANKELEAFSYSVSHDLRAPLRAIDGFSSALIEEHRDKLDDAGRHYLDRIRSGAQRMADLIDDLLSLSHITRAPLNRERVDISGLSRRILLELGEGEPQRALESVIADGLFARGDRRLLAVALENLLGNAWKFSSKQAVARIEVGSKQHQGETVFFVHDNGAGFDMSYAKKLFAPFQRLHAQHEFAGTGIGLATVHRVVARHGGRVWAEATPGRGATFFFTLAERA
jgi:signal transduction histidine kinase